MSRKMAYVVTVNKIDPIEGKDRIVYAHFTENGYGVICDKSFSEGDKAIYFEVDSVLPVRPEFEFLRKRCYKENLNGFLIKNIKMNGLYSNGLIIHFSELGLKKMKAGTDLTDKLNIKKFEDFADASPKQTKRNPVCDFMMKHFLTRWLAKKIWFHSKVGGEFPVQYISKSDETNIQNEKAMFEKWKDIPCYITRKHEGQSVTMIMLPNKKSFDTRVFGRNTNGNEKQYAFADKQKIDERFKQVWKDTKHCYAVQGEFCGPGIQKNIHCLKDYRFFVYTVKDITEGKLLPFFDMCDFCDKYGFERVKCVVSSYLLSKKFSSVNELQEYTEHMWFKKDTTDKNPESWNDVDDRVINDKKPDGYMRWEGIVIRGMNNEFSFKVKSNEYALTF